MNNRIQDVIKAVGLKKIEFAKRLRLSAPYISELCSGKTYPSDRTIADICREFRISEAWLRTGQGEMFTNAADSTVDRLAREYGLDSLGREIITAYLKLDEQDRMSVGQLIQNIIDERTAAAPVPETEQAADQEAPIVPPGYSSREELEAEARAEAEEYYREILEEKRRAASGSASSDTSTSGTA